MKKKFISITTKCDDGVKVDFLSFPEAHPEQLLALLQLMPVGSSILVEIKEMELPDMTLSDIHPHS